MKKHVPKQKKRIPDTQPSAQNNFAFLVHGNLDKLKLLNNSILSIKDTYQDLLDIYLYVPEISAETIPAELEALKELAKKNKLHFLNTSITFGEALQHISMNISSNYIAILEINSWEQSCNLNELFTIKNNQLHPEAVFSLFFRDPDYDIPKKSGIFLYPEKIFKYLTNHSFSIKNTLHQHLKYKTEKLQIPLEEINLAGKLPLNSEFRSKRPNFIFRIRFFFDWYFRTPVSEFRNKNIAGLHFIKEPSFYRMGYAVIILALLLLMPILSRDAGISGDEVRHYQHAGYVYNYYMTLGKDKTALNTPTTLLHHYGQSFDNITYFLVQWFKIENVYEFRHFLNSLAGWLTILFASLIAVFLGNYRAGIITAVLLFISPRFLGHSLNNPLDIPYTMANIFTLYYIFKFNREFPAPAIKTRFLLALGIGMAISMRIGGILLIAYASFFIGLGFLVSTGIKNLLKKENLIRLRKLIMFLIPVFIAGYLIGLLLWPYALQNPLKNPFESLKAMTNISTALRQLFEGKFIWSDNVPWYYSVKYIGITVPIVVFTGILLLILFFRGALKKYKSLNIFILAFTIIFPIVYIIYKKSNVYGGWRHLLFIYPPMVILSGLGFELLLQKIRNTKILIATGIFILALSFHPIRHIIVNHPHEYVYFNEIIGGVNTAYGKYEMDYYFHSFKAASDWLIENELEPSFDSTHVKIVSANAGIDYYYRNIPQYAKPLYVRYYQRGEKDWDYGVFANSYLSSFQQEHGIYPPKGTIHTINVDKVPICAIVKREDKNDYIGFTLTSENKIPQSIDYYIKALEYDPNNETALLQLTSAYVNTNQLDDAILTANKCLKIYPDYDKALNLLGVAYMNKREFNNALGVFNRIIKVNAKFVTAYYNVGLTYAQMNDADRALYFLNKAIEVNGRFKPSYYLAAQILERLGKSDQAKRYMDAANSM